MGWLLPPPSSFHPPPSPKIMSCGSMAIRASHKRAARDVFITDMDSDDTYAMSEDISEDESIGSYQDQIISHDDPYRMLSPKSTMDMPMMLGGYKKPTTTQSMNSNDDMAEKRVTIWNWREQRKLSGNSAPFKKNLQEYLRKHPDWEEYIGQDKDENGKKNFAPKKRRKDNKPGDAATKIECGNRKIGLTIRTTDSNLMPTTMEAVARRRVTEASTRQRVQAEAEAAWRHAKQEAAKQKEQEEKEACRWREFSAIQHIIDHYNQGPSKSPFVGDNAMMNA